MTALLPRLLDTGVLPLAELHAVRLDGELYRIGDAFATVDTPDTAELRAAAFRLSVPRAAVADRSTAAWIHGTRAGPPSALQVCVDSAQRVSATALHGLDVRQCILAQRDVVLLGEVRVTAPLRTVADLLRTEDRFTPAVILELRALLELSGYNAAACRDEIRRQDRLPGTRRALIRLAAMDSVLGDATDYDPERSDSPFRKPPCEVSPR
ncbi:hypothetical protein [Leifsonia sp. NPDC058230]|uniref:hypothetical protein n=1 Tax=Leifsonia sp. NPDC058230 TaxID=3346391 RepID=UPI0036DD81B4